jgi:hypothetical protein
LPFGYGYPSDHRAIFARIVISKILATEVHPSKTVASRGLIVATPKEQERCMVELDLHYQSQNLYKRLQDLWAIPHDDWNESHEMEYNKCDEQHIISMLAAERKHAKSN